MPIVDLGETYSWRVQVANEAGVLGAPSTGPTVTLTLPDGSAGGAPTVTVNAAGDYFVETPVTGVVGRHVLTATASGGQLGTGVTRKWSDPFDVDDPAGLAVVSVPEAVDFLGLPSTVPTERVRVVIAQANAACSGYLGRQTWRRTFTELHDGGSGGLRLRQTPVVAISAVTEGTATVTSTGYVLNPLTGILERGTTSGAWGWQRGVQNVSVTYVAGYTDPPHDLRLAVLREIEHLWQATQQRAHMTVDDSFNNDNEFGTTYGGPASIPSQVRYLLDGVRDSTGLGAVSGRAVGV